MHSGSGKLRTHNVSRTGAKNGTGDKVTLQLLRKSALRSIQAPPTHAPCSLLTSAQLTCPDQIQSASFPPTASHPNMVIWPWKNQNGDGRNEKLPGFKMAVHKPVGYMMAGKHRVQLHCRKRKAVI